MTHHKYSFTRHNHKKKLLENIKRKDSTKTAQLQFIDDQSYPIYKFPGVSSWPYFRFIVSAQAIGGLINGFLRDRKRHKELPARTTPSCTYVVTHSSLRGCKHPTMTSDKTEKASRIWRWESGLPSFYVPSTERDSELLVAYRERRHSHGCPKPQASQASKH